MKRSRAWIWMVVLSTLLVLVACGSEAAGDGEGGTGGEAGAGGEPGADGGDEMPARMTIGVRVLDAVTDEPIDGATVRLVDEEDHLHEGETSAEGRWSFDEPLLLEDETYEVSATAIGYLDGMVSFAAADGTSVDIRLTAVVPPAGTMALAQPITQLSESITVDVTLTGVDLARLVVRNETAEATLFDDSVGAGAIAIEVEEAQRPGDSIVATLEGPDDQILATASAIVVEATGGLGVPSHPTHRDASIEIEIETANLATVFLLVRNMTTDVELFSQPVSAGIVSVPFPTGAIRAGDVLSASLFADEARQKLLDQADATVIYQVLGAGTVEDPFLIFDRADLERVALDLAAHYRVVADIDLGDVPFAPLGSEEARFTGSLDGASHELVNLKIVANQPGAGLFGWIGADGEVRDLRLRDVSVEGTGLLGAVAGRSLGTLEGIVVDGYVEGTGNSVGGLVGINEGTIRQSRTAAQVTGANNIGGLVGVHLSGRIEKTAATGNIGGASHVGGLVGTTHLTEGPEIVESWASGEVTGTATGNAFVGGLVGRIVYGTIERCYALGNVGTPGTFAGGLVGFFEGERLIEVFSAGYVTGSSMVGGLIGYNSSDYISNVLYFDKTTSGRAEGIGAGVRQSRATGLETEQMQGDAPLTNMPGLDFEGAWTTVDGDYPGLIDNPR